MLMPRTLSAIVAVLMLSSPSIGQDPGTLPVDTFKEAIDKAVELTGFPLPPDIKIVQADLQGAGFGEVTVDANGKIKMTIDSVQIGKSLKTLNAQEIAALVTVTLAHEMFHAKGYGLTDEEADEDWWEGPASQSSCEHVAIYLNDLKVTCAIASEPDQADRVTDRMCYYFELQNGDLSGDGNLAAMLALCLAAQGATPPGYTPPVAALTLTENLPICEGCNE